METFYPFIYEKIEKSAEILPLYAELNIPVIEEQQSSDEIEEHVIIIDIF